jgi:hypothetical protein
MATRTRIGAAIDALLGILRGTPSLAQVDIVDGPPLDWGSIRLPSTQPQKGDGTSFLFVGASPDATLAAESTLDWNAAGAVSRDERLQIVCTAVGWSGALDTKAARDLVLTRMGDVEDAIHADPTIAGSVLYSEVSSVDHLDYVQTDRGLAAVAVFRVACRAYLS